MPDTRDAVFDRILVDHLVRGGTRVSWQYFRLFADPPPYTTTLQYGHTGDPDADDWADVAGPLENVFTMTDPNREMFGGLNPTDHYRVVLVTSRGTYTSRPAAVYGILDKRGWLYANELVRRFRLMLTDTAVDGWLLKRRREGAGQTDAEKKDPRTAVTDPLTGDVIRRQDDQETLGTGFKYGYYRPVPFKVDMSLGGTNEQTTEQGQDDTDDRVLTGNKILLIPQVSAYDVWVALHSDLRYTIHEVKVLEAITGVPLIGTCDLRLLPFNDVVYSVDLTTAGGP